ncbi:hypothetical protein C8F01DRAFT_993448 [Mycena amicta]|nr:hypothetical protein C8F01DRAFT_993448 [Mycena amicta]
MSSSRRRKHRTSNSLPFPTTTPSSSEVSSAVAFSELLLELIRQLYFFALLRIPSLYFMRVSRLIEDANVSLPDILQMSAQRAADPASNGNMYTFTVLNYASPSALPPHILQFRTTWNSFIDNLMREWKTQNVVSGLLLSALLTMLQIDGAATDPVTRITALMSLVGTLVSLLFGSIYTVRFGTMRRMYKAACWAMDAQEGRRYVLWNVWILLAMPGVWLAWSMLSFIVCIMAFVWRTGAASESTASNGLTSNAALTMRVLVSVELFVAGLYLVLVLRTFATYGEVMDRTWRDKVLAAKNGDSKAPRSKQMQKEMPASDRERPRSSNSSRVSLGASDKSSSSSSSSSSSTQPQRGPLAPWYPGVNTINQPASGHAPIANAPWMPIPRNQSWGHETAVPPSIPAMLGHEPSPKIPAVKVVELGEYWTLLYPYDTSLKWRDISKKRWKRLATVRIFYLMSSPC